MFNKDDVCFYVIGSLLVAILVTYLRMDYYEFCSKSLQTQLNALQVESAQLKVRYGIIDANAAEAMANSQTQVDGMMTAAVSSDCDEAMDWGIEQAKGFA